MVGFEEEWKSEVKTGKQLSCDFVAKWIFRVLFLIRKNTIISFLYVTDSREKRKPRSPKPHTYYLPGSDAIDNATRFW